MFSVLGARRCYKGKSTLSSTSELMNNLNWALTPNDDNPLWCSCETLQILDGIQSTLSEDLLAKFKELSMCYREGTLETKVLTALSEKHACHDY